MTLNRTPRIPWMGLSRIGSVVFPALVLLLASSAWSQAGKNPIPEDPGRQSHASSGGKKKLFRWKDAQGRIHISDVEPSDAGIPVEKMRTPTHNTVQPFAMTPAPATQGGQRPSGLQEPSEEEEISADEDGEEKPRPFSVEARQKACEEKKKAYAAAKACFDACGSFNYDLYTRRSGRNNSACGHCTDAIDPNC